MFKHLHKASAFVLLCCGLWAGNEVQGQSLVEHFNYPVGAKLTENGWTAHSSGGTNAITTSVAAAELTFPGYIGSGVGNAVTLATSGEDINRKFEEVTSGSVYAAFLINVATATANGDYFLHLGETNMGSNYIGRVFAKASGDGFTLGISKGSNPAAVYGSQELAFGTTHLVVLKYTFNAETNTDDVVAIYANPVLNGAEPTTATATATVGGNDVNNLGTIALRQGSSSNAASLTVDGLAVATSWADLKAATPVLTENFNYTPGTNLSANGWSAHSGAGTNAIATTTGGTNLRYEGYAASGIGEAVKLRTSGEDANKSFGAISEGSVYAGFLVNVTSAQAGGDYFFHLGPESIGSTYTGRVYVRSSGDGFQFGLSKVTTPAAVYGETVYNYGTTYLVVMKYSIVDGASNDGVEIFVNPVVANGEPAVATLAAAVGGSDPANIGSVALRQGSGSAAAELTVDGIVIGTSWDVLKGFADVTGPAIANLSPADGATEIRTIAIPQITFDENVTKGTGNILFKNLANDEVLHTVDVASEAVMVEGATATINVNLLANTHYYVEIPATAFVDGAGNAFVGISNNTAWDFTTVAQATPVLTTTVTTLNLGAVVGGSTSSVAEYVLSATDLQTDVVLTTSAPFAISKTNEDAGFSTNLTITAAELAFTAQKIYVRATAPTTGVATGSIQHTSANADNITISLQVEGYNPYAQNFDSCEPVGSGSMPGGWQQISVEGDVTWGCTTFGRTGNAVQINGYSSATGRGAANEDWLISPALDLSAYEIPRVSFWTRSAFKGPALKLMVSTDYSGTGAPSAATWTELNANFPEVNSDVWTESVVLLDAYKENKVYVAIVYTSLDAVDASSRWTVDDFSVEDVDNSLVTSNLDFDFGAIPANSFSEARPFTVKALGFEDGLTISASENFQVSKDNVTYSASISYTAEEIAEETMAFVRFFPLSTALSFEGEFTFKSGDEFTENRGKLTGSSIPKSTTLDVVTWNVEWFGADVDGDGKTLGPVNDELQFANVKQAILAMDADIYALQEIANDEAMERLVSELPGYAFVKSDTYSYSQREANFVATPQKLYVVYKTGTVKVAGEKVLLKQLYTDILSNETVLPNYPGSGADNAKDDSFWASGRLPHMVILDATINNVTQRLHLLNIHARANSGTNMTVYNQRKYDLQVLKDSLDAQYPNINLIMLGDYNDDVDMAVVGTNNPSSYKPFVDDENYNVLTYDLSLTGVGTYQASSFLDHIAISKQLNDEYITNSIKIEDGLATLIPRYFTTTSDHLPVSARFSFDATPVVTFTEATLTKTEDAGKFNVNLTLSEAQATEHTVTVMIADDATASAADYNVTGIEDGKVTVTIPANATTASFEIEIADDNLVELSESVSFIIHAASTGLGLTSERSFELTIEDNDKSAVSFAETTLEVNEDAGTKTITLNLDQATVQEEELVIAVTNGATVTADDYTTTPAAADGKITITIPTGATSATFTIIVNDDTEVEETETVTFALSSYSAKLMEGENASFTLSIRDNDMPTGLARRKNQEFRMYPNPTRGAVTIVLPEDISSTEKVTMTVHSPEGIRMHELKGNLSTVIEQLNNRLPVLRNGMYFVQIQVRDKVFQSRLIKN